MTQPVAGAEAVLRSLRIHADPHAWQRLGLMVGGDGIAQIGSCGLQLVDSEPRGITSWTVTGRQAGRLLIDGLHTQIASDPEPRRGIASAGADGVPHLLRATLIDHVVVMTPSLDRTCAAIAESTGAPLKRVREVGRGVRQGFHRLGEVIVEVVERPDIPPGDPARFWGLVLVVEDLAMIAEHLGPAVLGPVKPAVQPGRLIATVRESAGLGLPVALMSA